MVGIAAPSASALGTKSWSDCLGAYVGKSWESPGNGAIWAHTTRSGGCGYVYVALRNGASIKAGTARDSTTAILVDVSWIGSNNPVGGAHKSRSGGGIHWT
jgi:hypothetical protein